MICGHAARRRNHMMMEYVLGCICYGVGQRGMMSNGEETEKKKETEKLTVMIK
jgi:hypothetical protein